MQRCWRPHWIPTWGGLFTSGHINSIYYEPPQADGRPEVEPHRLPAAVPKRARSVPGRRPARPKAMKRGGSTDALKPAGQQLDGLDALVAAVEVGARRSLSCILILPPVC